MSMPHETASAVAEGRDARGRFTKGNRGGPGNPFVRQVAELRRTLLNFETQDDMKHVAFVLREKAMGGDVAAIKLLFRYLLGKPKQTAVSVQAGKEESERPAAKGSIGESDRYQTETTAIGRS
jgi:hypothetical protein